MAVVPGELVWPEGAGEGVMRGPGVSAASEEPRAAVVGLPRRTSRLVSVQSAWERTYGPEDRDVVVGRVSRVGAGRWEVDVGLPQPLPLRLDNVLLPGINRSRTSADESNMRSWFDCGELLCAEVKLDHSRVHLLVQSASFGKLSHGLLVRVFPGSVRGAPQFMELSGLCAETLRLVLGRNGWIWISGPREPEGAGECVVDAARQDLPATARLAVVRLAQAIRERAGAGGAITREWLQGWRGE